MRLEEQVIDYNRAAALRNLCVAQEPEVSLFAYPEVGYGTKPPIYKAPIYNRDAAAFTLSELVPVAVYLVEELSLYPTNKLIKKHARTIEVGEDHLLMVLNINLLCDFIIEVLNKKRVGVKKINEILRKQ